jgi:hypothetical protein
MTLVQAAIAENGNAVILTSDRLLSRRLSDDVPHYEFEADKPKIIPRNTLGVGFAGSQLYAELISDMILDGGHHEFDRVTEEISDFIESERDDIIHNEIRRRTGIDDPDLFFQNPQLPIPEEVRRNIYGYMGETEHSIVNARCLVAGFDVDVKARIAVVDDEGDVQEATGFGEISIGSGATFSTIYFDQHEYSTDCPFPEAVLFNFEAKKWAEAPSGVGVMTDMITMRKGPSGIDLNEIHEGSPTLASMERYYQEQQNQMRKERQELHDEISVELTETDE